MVNALQFHALRFACTASACATATTRQRFDLEELEAIDRRTGGSVSTSKGKRAGQGELLAAGPKQGMRAKKAVDFFGLKIKNHARYILAIILVFFLVVKAKNH